jgi:hypothetical protein
MGIAAKNMTASDDESLMPDPVNAWTRTHCGPSPPSAKRRDHEGGPGARCLANASPVKSVPFKCSTSEAAVKTGSVAAFQRANSYATVRLSLAVHLWA